MFRISMIQHCGVCLNSGIYEFAGIIAQDWRPVNASPISEWYWSQCMERLLYSTWKETTCGKAKDQDHGAITF
jgi:hypothetical protein